MAKVTSLNTQFVIDGINNFLRTDSGKLITRRAVSSNKGSRSGSGLNISNDTAMNIAEELKKMILAYAGSQFTTSQISIFNSINNIDIRQPIDNGDGTFRIDLNLDGDLRRDSLSHYSDGAYNIVSLFIHGWDDKSGKISKLFGMWNDKLVRAKTSRSPMSFAEDAVDLFNSKYAHLGVHAELGDEYK